MKDTIRWTKIQLLCKQAIPVLSPPFRDTIILPSPAALHTANNSISLLVLLADPVRDSMPVRTNTASPRSLADNIGVRTETTLGKRFPDEAPV